jgi:serine/threonine-protein kinase
MTRAGTLKGKVGYMSPEQCRGDPVDRRSDVFGLGVLLYELTVGRRAFWAESDYAVVGKVIDGDYIPPGRLVAQYPAMLEGLIARALHNDPAARPPTADALAKDLRQFAGDHRLDLEAAHRAAVLRDRCGIEPFPVVDLAALARRRAKRRPGSTGRLVGLLGLGATIGVAGFFVGGLARSDEAPEVVPGPKSAVAPLREAASTDQPDALPTVVPQPPDPREREPDDDRGEADLRPELEASGARPVRAGSPRRRSRSRRKTAARPTTGDPDTLLPPTLRKP